MSSMARRIAQRIAAVCVAGFGIAVAFLFGSGNTTGTVTVTVCDRPAVVRPADCRDASDDAKRSARS
jgi:hypothetical protein